MQCILYYIATTFFSIAYLLCFRVLVIVDERFACDDAIRRRQVGFDISRMPWTIIRDNFERRFIRFIVLERRISFDWRVQHIGSTTFIVHLLGRPMTRLALCNAG